ncbi:methylated-DNA--[protein]-cysteine S-methyltransferase [Schaalia sp. Marseille-Q2122]|uniref:methylated-DNA--[protein]-cysteine S-methyltransferase n=1 Tax=Schaalia sp. Marseille-Q2122 TaxID=2736604 RepID=UPI00158A8DDA|nr:methylated-DNA--[protein]-cysteine S-methyltransferase [Schaalia sp. Marseille-Q2122]
MNAHQAAGASLEVRVRVRGLLAGIIAQADVEICANAQGVTRVILGDRLPTVPKAPTILIDAPDVKVPSGCFTAGSTNAREGLSAQPDEARAWHHARQAAEEIADYLRGERQHFTVPLSPASTSPFTASVHEAIATIPYGQRRTYADLAAALGNAGATRAVGTACGKNPLPILVPCHRVVRADGTLGRYTGGDGIKVALLALEGGDHGGQSAERTPRG